MTSMDRFFRDGAAFVTGAEDGSCKIFDIRSTNALATLTTPNATGVYGVDVSACGKHVYVASENVLYDFTTITGEQRAIANFDHRVSCVSVCKQGDYVACGSWDAMAYVYAEPRGEEEKKEEKEKVMEKSKEPEKRKVPLRIVLLGDKGCGKTSMSFVCFCRIILFFLIIFLLVGLALAWQTKAFESAIQPTPPAGAEFTFSLSNDDTDFEITLVV